MVEQELKKDDALNEPGSMQAEGEALDATEAEMVEEVEHETGESPAKDAGFKPVEQKKPLFGSGFKERSAKGPGLLDRIQRFMADAKRIFHVSRKPDRKEYMGMLKITALGIIVIGVLGFFIILLFGVLGL